MINVCGIGIVKNRDNGEFVLVKGVSHEKDDVFNKGSLKGLRRADNFSKIAVLAAKSALDDSLLSGIEKDRIGLILVSAFGPHITTFRFLDDILNYGDNQVSPILFSNSVHNASASYISTNLNLQGPTLSITHFTQGLLQASYIAQSWLGENRCDYILLGHVDQSGKELEYILSRTPELKPFSAGIFMLLSKNDTPKTYCAISDIISAGNIYITLQGLIK